MNATWLIAKREIRSFFLNPLGYFLLSLYTFLSGYIFFNLLVSYVDSLQSLPAGYAGQVSFIEEVVLRFYANQNFLLLFFIPLISMKVFAEEKKNKTLDLYWMSPVSEWSIIFGKYLGMLFVLVVMMLLSLVYPTLLFFSGLDDYSVVLFCEFAFFMNGCAYLAMGIFASSLTDSQMLASLISLVMILFMWLLNWAAQNSSNYAIAEILHYLGMTPHFEQLLKGNLSLSDMTYYLSFIFIFIILTRKSLRSRFWLV